MNLVERSTSHAPPVSLRVLHTGDGVAVVCARSGPAGFGDPDPFARRHVVDGAAHGVDAFPEGGAGAADGGALEVGVCVYADEVRGFDYGCVCGVDPGGEF